ncbi:MAG: YdcF family protein, partial [Alphaproteobacteria bacterium]
RLGRALLALGAVLLVGGSMPVTGQAMLSVLASGAPRYEAGRTDLATLDAVVVALAGSFPDGTGRWWPLPGSIVRTVRGQHLQRENGVPRMVLGGAPLPGQTEPEAVAVQRLISLDAEVSVESTARDSYETAQAVAAQLARMPLPDRPRRVLLVTSNSHIMRMSASLRRFGVGVVGAPLAYAEDRRLLRADILDFVPSARGMGNVRVAWREFVGIGWYLATGRIRLRDF